MNFSLNKHFLVKVIGAKGVGEEVYVFNFSNPQKREINPGLEGRYMLKSDKSSHLVSRAVFSRFPPSSLVSLLSTYSSLPSNF